MRLRGKVDDRFEEALGDSHATKLLVALTVGSRHRFAEADWEVFRRTGTTHLVAISGLHVGLIAFSLGACCRSLLLRLLPHRLTHKAQDVSILIALVGGLGYALLAGFGLPVQRALIMVAAASAAWWFRQRLQPLTYFGLALWLVLVSEPLAPLTAGFWLSFGAVLVLMACLSDVPRRWRWLAAQVAIGVVLLPLMLALFGEAWPTASLVNLAAIPWFATIVIPGSLLAAVLPEFALATFAGVVEHTWSALSFAAQLPIAPLRSIPSPQVLAVALLGSALFMILRGFPVRWLALFGLLPLTSAAPSGLDPGQFRLVLLDVGQGLAAIVRTARHTLVFDAGPSYPGGGDAGERVVVPALTGKGWSPSLLVVSHGDTDHVGGAASVLKRFPDLPVMGGAEVALRRSERCVSGRRWRWDGVDFVILHPSARRLPGRNDGSCVLRVAGPGGSVLLTGDIQRLAEARLLARRPDTLSADVVTVPHHGSRTSSTASFVRAASPRYALVSAGFANRWGFPDPAVVSRWEEQGGEVLTTAAHGGIEIEFTSSSPPTVVQVFRGHPKRFWRLSASHRAY